MVAPAAPTCSCAGRGALNAKVRSVAPWGQGGKGSWEGAGGGWQGAYSTMYSTAGMSDAALLDTYPRRPPL